ncbi:M20 family metallopeptidase [Xanthobacteraceae bacterium Astr-EGSB]|uniref:M20 family metallopeptidase n=1 Tax=Astrobacterium formosum TaxID=3069710 RepID=UPI0027B4063A|nr:M20 family metallopeptidase [Xanthobacteraceae bacterium Astr-EGSB]
MSALSSQEQSVLDWLAGARDDMVALTAELVNIDSGSHDKAGVDAVGTRLAAYLAGQGIASTFVPDVTYGDALVARLGGDDRPVLLMGHRDTVFSQGEAARRPFRTADGRGHGPGCADMKAGLVQNAFVMAALARFGAPVPVVGLFTSDEEIGSPSSRPVIEAEAKRARAVFNSEPGRPSGAVVTARKGGAFMRCEVLGRAAHAGNNLADGVSAIEEAARKIIALHALTDFGRGVTVHVGIVNGGEAVNMVAPRATFTIDLRYIDPADRTATLTAIEAIVDRPFLSGTSARLETAGEFLPLVASAQSERLFGLYVDCARAVGRDVTGEFAGGCADSGFTASIGTPTLCGVGPVGGRAHSPDEYLELDTVVPRAQSLALAILRIDRLSMG